MGNSLTLYLLDACNIEYYIIKKSKYKKTRHTFAVFSGFAPAVAGAISCNFLLFKRSI